MQKGLHHKSIFTVYKKKGKVFFFFNSYHKQQEIQLKLLNFKHIKTMNWPLVLLLEAE
jgi:hypothetical protein